MEQITAKLAIKSSAIASHSVKFSRIELPPTNLQSITTINRAVHMSLLRKATGKRSKTLIYVKAFCSPFQTILVK